MFKYLFSFIILLAFLNGCKKSNDQGPPKDTDVIFMGHKGGGSNSFGPHFENTIPAIQDGIKNLDGVENDIQMSLDSTLWIFHNPNFNSFCCDTSNHSSIILLHDSEIEKIQLCNNSKTDRIYRLSELINLWNASTNGFYVSLEVKSAFTKAQFTQVGGKTTYLLKLARRLALLFTPLKHKDKLFVETYEKDFCSKFKTLVSGVYICMLYDGSFTTMISTALKDGFHGLSASYMQPNITAQEVQRARDSGLVIELWTPYYYHELTEAFALHPTVIQTDNLNAKTLLNVY